MPDRVTNTMNIVVDGKPAMLCRPTVINMYGEDLGSIEKWWAAWKEFIFSTEVTMPKKGKLQTNKISSLFEPISAKKYPAVTPEEEAMSIPLQVLCQAIFDAVLVHMMNSLAPKEWQPLKM